MDALFFQSCGLLGFPAFTFRFKIVACGRDLGLGFGELLVKLGELGVARGKLVVLVMGF